MNRKVFSLIIVVLVALAGLPAQAADETSTIGLSLPATTGFTYEGIADGARLAAEEAGIELAIASAEFDVETELANVQSLIDQGVDAIVFSPTDAEASVEAIATANEAGVPIFVIGNVAPGETDIDVAGTFAPDAREVGALSASVLCEAYETGTILELTGYTEDDDDALAVDARDMSEGFNAELADTCPAAAVQTLNVAGLDRDAIFDEVTSALADGDISLIFAYNDTSTLAVVDAAFRQNVQVVGVGTSEELVSSVEKIDHLIAVIIPDVWGMGESAVETSLRYLNGEDIVDDLSVDVSVLDLDMITLRCPPWYTNCSS